MDRKWHQHRKCEYKRLYSIKHPTQRKLEQTESLWLPGQFWSETTFMNHVTSVHRHKKDTQKNQNHKKESAFFFKRDYLVMCIFPRSAVTHIEQNKRGSPLVPLPQWKICEDAGRASDRDRCWAASLHFPVWLTNLHRNPVRQQPGQSDQIEMNW